MQAKSIGIHARAKNAQQMSDVTACRLSFDERLAEHDRLTAENAPPLNPQGKPDWKHPDFDRCSNDWWRLGLCDHCRADGGCDDHAIKQFPTLFPDKFPAPIHRTATPRAALDEEQSSNVGGPGAGSIRHSFLLCIF